MIEWYQAKYFIALAENKLTDNIRNEFNNIIDFSNIKWVNGIFTLIVTTIFDAIDNRVYNTQEAIENIKNEFLSLELDIVCGDYSNYSDFIAFVVHAYSNKEEINNKNAIIFCQELLQQTEKLPEPYKSSVYYAILSYLVNSNQILINKNLTNHLLSQLDDKKDSDISVFSKIISKILFQI